MSTRSRTPCNSCTILGNGSLAGSRCWEGRSIGAFLSMWVMHVEGRELKGRAFVADGRADVCTRAASLSAAQRTTRVIIFLRRAVEAAQKLSLMTSLLDIALTIPAPIEKLTMSQRKNGIRSDRGQLKMKVRLSEMCRLHKKIVCTASKAQSEENQTDVRRHYSL
jgi:hypothetical protein